MKKKEWWLRFGCFLTDHNYEIVTECGHAAITMVKKYLSAMLIIIVMWSFIGYCFTERYLNLHRGWPWIGALLMGFIIVQIERIVIHFNSDKKLFWNMITLKGLFRMPLALLMTLIGSIVIDPIIFKDDIEKIKEIDHNNQLSSLNDDRQKQSKPSYIINGLLNKGVSSTTTYKDGSPETTKSGLPKNVLSLIERELDRENTKEEKTKEEGRENLNRIFAKRGLFDDLKYIWKAVTQSPLTIVVACILGVFVLLSNYLFSYSHLTKITIVTLRPLITKKESEYRDLRI